MRSTPRLVICILFIFFGQHANAQWLKMIESSDNLYKDAKREIELKHYQKAIFLCNKAKDISSKNLDIHLLLGKAYMLSGKTDSANAEFNFVLEKNPKYRDAYIYLINIQAAACNYQQALEYADIGLKYFPNDREILLKKLDVYMKMGDWMESNKLADYLYERFSTDAYVRSVYLDFKLSLARQYSHRGYIEIAKQAYEAVLEQDPMNKEALQAIFTLDLRSGNYESSLAFTNRALQSTPNSYEFLMKKVSILDDMSRYVEAIEVLEKLIKLYPTNAEVRKVNTYVRMEAGRFYMNTDPYLQFQAVLEMDPTNQDALNYVINIASTRGLYADALGFINQALKRTPNDRELIKKKVGTLESMKNYGSAAILAEKIYKENPSQATKETFLELRLLSAKQYMNNQEYDTAIKELNSVLFYERNNMAATNYLINSYIAEKRYDDALRTINDALLRRPGDEQLLFKKAGILEAGQHFADAAQISGQLLQKHPQSKQYLVSLVDQSLAAGRQSMQYDDYFNTLKILKEVLDKQPDNIDALNYIINLEVQLKQYNAALLYVDQALKYYPESTDFLFKKAVVYAEDKKFQSAYSITGQLYANYPYNTRFRNALVDQLVGSGKEMLLNNKKDSALMEFHRALLVSPTDTIPLYNSISLLNDLKQYDSALVLTERGRAYYPNNPYFLMKRAQIMENKKKWEPAWLAMDTLVKQNPTDQKLVDYWQYLYSGTLRNEFGVSYLQSTIVDSTSTKNTVSSIATAQYTRKYTRGNFTLRLNYAGRFTGSGLQYEAETYYIHTKRWYSYGDAAYSPTITIFPTWKLGYSIFHNFDKGYTAELGIRYLQIQNGNIVSPLISISRELRDFYFSVRGSLITINHSAAITDSFSKAQYYSISGTTRYYLRENRTEYFSAIAGYGTAPDDISKNYDIARLTAYRTVNVGVGYQRKLFYRTTLQVNASWFNIEVEKGNFKNQYDMFFSLLRNF